MKVAKITKEKANFLAGKSYAPASHYNPIQDCDGDWVISIEEIEQTLVQDLFWVKELPLSDWCEPISNPSGSTKNI
jgi:hypothetical protein